MRWLFITLVLALAGATVAYRASQPMPRCEIIGDHEIVTGHCIPYCPPKPSECG